MTSSVSWVVSIGVFEISAGLALVNFRRIASPRSESRSSTTMQTVVFSFAPPGISTFECNYSSVPIVAVPIATIVTCAAVAYVGWSSVAINITSDPTSALPRSRSSEVPWGTPPPQAA